MMQPLEERCPYNDQYKSVVIRAKPSFIQAKAYLKRV